MAKFDDDIERIAVVGLSCRFPGANNADEFWENLCAGRESLTRFSQDELAGTISEELLNDADYVPVRGLIDDADKFDADFFGVSAREAEILDPQHRVFLECAWNALEDAGYIGSKYEGLVGAYAGMGNNSYFTKNLSSNPRVIDNFGQFQTMVCNEKDFVATRVAYMLGLKGPAISLNTGCSTSLVAVAEAFNALLNYECDMALAGGISIQYPEKQGYLYYEGSIASSDGHCRPFDDAAEGTVFSNGAGIVVLKRLEDALEHGDNIYCVIRGVGINNDGSDKLSFTAPSVDGQAQAIIMAHASADLSPDKVSYIEAHGTATPVGDPIEIEALTQAYRSQTDKTQFCGVGSVKGNIGHTDAAAGIAGFIKTALAIRNEAMPANINFETPNSRIDFKSSPFFVNDKLQPWPAKDGRQIASVSSFGVGGTNAHVILEGMPSSEVVASAASGAAEQVLVLSAKSKQAVTQRAEDLAKYLKQNPAVSLANVAFTLQVGREAFAHRICISGSDTQEIARSLETIDRSRIVQQHALETEGHLVFMFPGGGAQYLQMGRNLYADEPVFQASLDRGLKLCKEKHGIELYPIWFAGEEFQSQALEEFKRPSLQLPAIFILEMAMTELWASRGIKPKALIGHSLGENTAACVAGVFRYEDALGLVCLRGQLFETVEPGGMLSVALSAEELADYLGTEFDLATINGPEQCTVSGTDEAIARLLLQLNEQEIEVQKIPISIAAHSRWLEPILDKFRTYLKSIELCAPELPFVSNLTGSWITDKQASDPEYWVSHLRNTVRFADGVKTLLERDDCVFLEVGPGKTLGSLVKLQAPAVGSRVIPSLRHHEETISDNAFFNNAIGRLWSTGIKIDWRLLHENNKLFRVALPGYPFQHKKYLIEANSVNVLEEKNDAEPILPRLDSISTRDPGGSNLADPIIQLVPPAPKQQAITRVELIVRKLSIILADLSGLEHEHIDPAVSFLDMGFDSLFLTQASMKFKKSFGIRISLRQLFDEAPSISLLANYIDENLPESSLDDELATINAKVEDHTANSPTLAQQNEVSSGLSSFEKYTNSITSSSSLKQIFADQLELMQLQIELLANVGLQQPEIIDVNDAGVNMADGGLEVKAESCSNRNYKTKLNAVQSDIWLASQFGDDISCSYNIAYKLRMSGIVDKAAFDEAFQFVCKRYDALRVSISECGKFQIIHTDLEIPLKQCDMSELDQDEQIKKIEDLERREVTSSFDLTVGPLLRVMLVELASDKFAFIFTMHHLICDEISIATFLSDLDKRYTFLVSGKACEWRPVQQPDELSAEEEEATDDIEFWVDKYRSYTPHGELPADYTRSGRVPKFAAETWDVIDHDLKVSLGQLALNNNCTLFSLLLAAFQVFVARLIGQNDVPIGIPISTADRSECEVIGCHLNVLPIRSCVDPEMAFDKQVENVQREIFLGIENGQFSTGALLERLKELRNPATNSFVSVVFNLFKDAGNLDFSGIQTTLQPIPKAYEDFELFLDIVDTESDLQLRCVYNTSLFTEASVSRWMLMYKQILQSVVLSPAQVTKDIDWMPKENLQLISAWNKTDVSFAENVQFSTLVASKTSERENDIAVIGKDESLTYSQLEVESNQIANHLRSIGVATGDLVGVCVNRSARMLVSLLGIWKAGAAYVPLDPAYPAERVRYMLEASGIRVLVAEATSVGIIPDYDCQRVCLDRDRTTIAAAEKVLPELEYNTKNIAYVIFTSGSTGQPKGVQVPHGAMLNFLNSSAKTPGLCQRDRVLSVTTLSFDIAVLELYLPLLVGGTVVIADKDEVVDGAQLGKMLDDFDITVMQATPSTWRLMLGAGWQGCSKLKVLCGGEAFPVDLVEDLLPKVSEIWNMYGPTETTVWSTCYQIQNATDPIFIGRPIANTQCHVLDDNFAPVPIGIPGELFIGGKGVTLGYLEQEELTAERFVKDPFTNDSVSRLYRTGDLVKWNPCGQLEYLSRIDNQVKVRGYRIELGEIEAVLARNPAIRECVVIVREDSPGDQRLTAYVVIKSGSAFDTHALRENLASYLPGYMLPQQWVELIALPLTPNGKIDRNALPAVEKSNAQSPKNFEPSTTEELYLANIYKEVLDCDAPIYCDDNLFDIGGHSLLAAKIAAKIKHEKGLDVPMLSLITQTLGQIAHDYLENPSESGPQESVNEQGISGVDGRSRFNKFLDVLVRRK